MNDPKKTEVGTIAWTDLTVEDAEEISAFYNRVVRWNPTPVDMGGYSDFNMNTPASGTCVAGVCHARGTNSDLPAQWLMYIVVEDIEASRARCEELGGKLLTPVKDMSGQGRYCVIQDPAGAVTALWQNT
jgi:predicted enzyme related to lactoylglutathione lyase